MISQAAEYALRAAVCLAWEPAGAALTTQEIAARAGVPAGYLAKVLQVLARARVVGSQRGANGGFLLRRRPGDVTLMEIVEAVDGRRRARVCPLGEGTHGTAALCPLHRRLDELALAAEGTLRGITLGEVVEEGRGVQGCGGRAAGAVAGVKFEI